MCLAFTPTHDEEETRWKGKREAAGVGGCSRRWRDGPHHLRVRGPMGWI